MSSTSSVPPKETPFTYDPLTKKDYLKLMTGNPKTYCNIIQPTQCKQDPKDPELKSRCEEVYRACIVEAQRFALWHQMN